MYLMPQILDKSESFVGGEEMVGLLIGVFIALITSAFCLTMALLTLNSAGMFWYGVMTLVSGVAVKVIVDNM